MTSPDLKTPLPWWQRRQLESQGCSATDWDSVRIDPASDLSLIRDVDFEGRVDVGVLDRALYPGCGLSRARIVDSSIADGASVRNVGGGIINAVIGREAKIENVGRIEYEPEALCGMGTQVAVLDETGSRPVTIYPGITAQSAVLAARDPRWADENLALQTADHIEKIQFTRGIGEKATVRDCGVLFNVAVWPEVTIEGARRLANGMVVNNAGSNRSLAYVGHGVDADGFIIEDGSVDSGAILRHVYVGQGASLEKGFTAHDSLFFANSAMENGEAVALLAGPYTVSMHKGSLLIGAQTSFMNAGSGTNQSNHLYKLGPVHWGILERGVKTSSNSYLMHGAKIGAFSLLMGAHKTHPDSSEFPFSYLFGDARGATVVVPAIMLRSCGLMRDEMKWPTRDKRQKRKLPTHDRIVFEVLNPFTISSMLKALETISELIHLPADDDLFIRYKGMKISRASLERGRKMYTLAVYKYLHNKLEDDKFPEREIDGNEKIADWVDLGGLIITRDTLAQAKEAESVEERERIFDEAADRYPELERQWIASRFGDEWRVEPERIRFMAEEFDSLVEEDRNTYKDELMGEIDMLRL